MKRSTFDADDVLNGLLVAITSLVLIVANVDVEPAAPAATAAAAPVQVAATPAPAAPLLR